MPLSVGQRLGPYEVLAPIGVGGMGEVYRALDTRLDRTVAIKILPTQFSEDSEAKQRFDREARAISSLSHPNICQLYDVGSQDGISYIVMECLQGETLADRLEKGPLPLEQLLRCGIEICEGLGTAHRHGVIHRDLKPGNIMRDASGRVVIMDFGLARSLQGDGMTQTGMMIGTMEYMSPEQAMGKDLDARSDEFAVGLILYELLTGFMPYQAESAIASLVKRTQERVRPLVDVDSAIPPQLNDIVCRCLEREPNDRFGSVQQLADELEIWQGKKPRTGESIPVPSKIVAAPQSQRLPVKWIAIGLAVLVLAIAVPTGMHYWSAKRGQTAAVQGPVMSLAIVPFYNASGDSGMNWMGASIAEALSSDIGQSAHLRSVSAGRLQQVLQDLRVSSQSQMDLSTLKRVSEFTNADTIVYGQYEHVGPQTRITATIHDLKNDREFTLNADVATEQDLLASLEKLADGLREKLAANPEVLKELQGHVQHVTTKSIPALRAYDEGLQLARAGNNTQAVAKFEEATTQDPGFAMAFSHLAQTYAALGYDDKADHASRRAVELSENLPAQDRLLIQARRAGLMHDPAKAIAAYEQLAKITPDNADTQFALARLYEDSGNFDQAKKYLAKVLAADPKNVKALLASGRVDIKSGDSQDSLNPLNTALSLAITFGNEEQKGDAYHALGNAYQNLNKPEDALNSFNRALEIRKKIGDQRGVAISLGQIAAVQDTMGNPKAALASYQEAVEVERKIGDRSGLALNLTNLGSFYMDHGKFDEALKATNEALQMARDSGDEVGQATLLLNIGGAHFQKGEYQDALTYFQQCSDIRTRLKLPDPDCLHNLAFTNVKLGQYETALSQYLKAVDALRASGDKSGTALVSNDMGALFAAQGRYDAALKAQQEAVDLYRQLNDRSYLAFSALAAYGHTLAAAGREEEGQKNIEDALKLAREVNNDGATAEVLNDLGDSYFYLGNYASARQQYEQALQLAAKSKTPDQVTLANLNLAKLEVAQGRSQAAIPVLKKLKQDADAMGLKAESVVAAIYLGEALMATNHAAAAAEELDSAEARAEKLGLRTEQARAQYFLGAALAATGKTKEAVPHYREAVRILESISKEDGAARVLDRSDLKDIYREAAKAYQGGGA